QIRTKICGLKDAENLSAAINAGAAYIGFVFFPNSPRNISIEEAAALAASVPPGIAKVALLVDPDDVLLESITRAVPIDMIQLHGKETPRRVTEIKALTGLPAMKAIGVSGPDDIAQIQSYGEVADQLLIDAKAPKGADLPGGNGLSFDWTLIANINWPKPWMLAGGLTAQNVALAIEKTRATQVDVSSGVESAPGEKDPAKIRAFLKATNAITNGAAPILHAAPKAKT
ncbi:MAG: phosphoribosylanthranilate isomerase, partial [Halocynthiibacter sp.]